MTLNVIHKFRSHYRICKLLGLFFITITNNSIYAEGTKELAPGNNDRVFLYLNGDLYNNFGRYDGNADQRLFFNIANPDQEQVFLGFSQAVSSGHYPCSGNLITSYFRIKDPNGNVVFPNPNSRSGQLLDAITSNISSLQEAHSGPKPIAGETGYQPFIFDPSGLPAGDYYVEFSSFAVDASPGANIAIENWDITVATKAANPQAKKGRVFATNWSFYAPSIVCDPSTTYGWFDRSFNGSIYVLSKEGFVNLVDFKGAGFQPAAFNLYFNETGTNDSNLPSEDRKSIVGIGQSLAKQKIFLNNPDPVVYPSGAYGALVEPPELHACEPAGDACILVKSSQPGQVEVLIDLDKSTSDFGYTPNTSDVLLVFNIEAKDGEVAPYTRCIPWDGKDGFGKSLVLTNTYDISVVYQQGVYHLPIFDAEFLLNGISTTIVRPIPPSGILLNKLYYDDSNIPFEPGNSNKKIELDGCIAPCHGWTNKQYGNENTINTWFFANVEAELKNESLNCLIEANADYANTNSGVPIPINIIENDIGGIFLDLSSLKIITKLSDTRNEAKLANNGIINYVPDEAYVGLDSLHYTVCYNIEPKNTLCDVATVYIQVAPTQETNCSDGIDNDKDGFIDCDDSDCLPVSPTPIKRKSNK